MNFSQQLNELLGTVISVLIIPLLPVVTAYLIALIKKKTQEIESQIKTAESKRLSVLVENAVITAVSAANQTYLNQLPESKGGFSAEELSKASRMAKDSVASMLGKSTLESLKTYYKDPDIWLDSKIEYYFYKIRNNSNQPEPENMRQILSLFETL